MGRVYLACDSELDRRIAIKVLPDDVAGDPERLQRFRHEARTLASLNHPGIVTIYSVEEDRGLPFLTMELLEGTSLDALVPDGGLSPERFFGIAIPLVDAVAAAHDRGIVHRDLKPSNVMCTLDGRLKVLDFGLARRTGQRLFDEATRAATRPVTREGTLVGTLAYMSPEQISGDPIDQRSDIFSLGIVLFELATGRPPFEADTPAEVLSAILTRAPMPLARHRPDLPERLDSVIADCLQKNPSDRTPTAGLLALELRRLHRLVGPGVPVAAAGPSVSEPRMHRSIAVLAFASLSVNPDDEFFADGVAEEIINALGRLPDLKVAARTSAFSFKGKNEDLRRIGEQLGVGTVLEGSVRRSGARLRITAQLVDAGSGYHLWSERYDREMVDVFEIQDDIARSIASRLTATLARGPSEPLVYPGTSSVEAFQIYTQGRGLLEQRTAEGMQRAASFFRDAIARDDTYALAWAGLAEALMLLADYERVESSTLLPEARDAATRALALDPTLAEGYGPLALMHVMEHDAPAAVQALRRAIEFRPSYADAHNWLSWVLLLVGRPVEALATALRAVELNPISLESLNHVSQSRLANGDPEEALRIARCSLAIQPHFGTTSFYEALALYDLKRFREAASIVETLVVPWSGAGPRCIWALAEHALGNVAAARDTLATMADLGETACAALLHAALGQRDLAFAAFSATGRWDYWPALFVHHYFPDVLGPLRSDPRWDEVLRSVSRDWGGVSRQEVSR